MSRYSAIDIATIYGLDNRGVVVRVPVESRVFFSPQHPDRL
jgi:glutamine synthetase